MTQTNFTPESVIDGANLQANFAGVADGSDMHYNVAWTTYTPTWVASGTQPSIGNGTLTGRYIKVGRFVRVNLKLVIGSTSTMGTGYWTFTLPVNNASSGYDTYHFAVGMAYIEDLATFGYNGMCRIASNMQNRVYIHALTAGGTWVGDASISPTVPMTWATGDYICAEFMYESEE